MLISEIIQEYPCPKKSRGIIVDTFHSEIASFLHRWVGIFGELYEILQKSNFYGFEKIFLYFEKKRDFLRKQWVLGDIHIWPQ